MDICEQSIVGNTQLPVLRRCLVNKEEQTDEIRFNKRYYMKVTRDRISHIRIYIRNENLMTVPFEFDSLKCTLHLKKLK